MPLVTIEIFENVFNVEQKKEIIEKITETMIALEGAVIR